MRFGPWPDKKAFDVWISMMCVLRRGRHTVTLPGVGYGQFFLCLSSALASPNRAFLPQSFCPTQIYLSFSPVVIVTFPCVCLWTDTYQGLRLASPGRKSLAALH